MNRKDFIRNTLIAIAASFLPKSLMPIDNERLLNHWAQRVIKKIKKYEIPHAKFETLFEQTRVRGRRVTVKFVK